MTGEVDKDIHRFPMATLLKYLRRHIPWCPTSRRQHMKLFLIHNPTEAEIRNQQIRVILRGSEKQVLGFEIPVHDAVVVEVSDCAEGGADEVCGVGFVVAAFAADAVEEFAAEG